MCALSRSATLSPAARPAPCHPWAGERYGRAEDADLTADVHHAPQPVDVLGGQPEHLALAQPEPGPHVGQRLVPGWQVPPHRAGLPLLRKRVLLTAQS
jgi:hypothetical protein